MSDKRYNGWQNYETWAVALWIDNEEISYNYWREQAADHKRNAPACEPVKEGIWSTEQAARFNLADHLKREFEDDNPLADEANLWADLMSAALSEVNWHEVADHYLDEA
jgi:hypothetical protein